MSVKGAKGETYLPESGLSIAVFPVENLSGSTAPLRVVRESLIGELRAKGFRILEEEALEKFMVRNRIRYASGIDDTTARALRKETGAEAVLITSVELYSDAIPPKVAISSRLVSTGEAPVILWADGVGMAGDDAPGILGLGLIEDPSFLLKKTLGTLVSSLERYSAKTEKQTHEKIDKKFEPRISYRSPALAPDRKYTVAVIPFFNLSNRKNAGEVMVLQFIRNLQRSESFNVIEPGLIRKAFLTLRMIIEEGLSMADANILFASLNADVIITGKVVAYQDYEGSYGKPKVDFSVQFIGKETQKVLWSSVSHNEGDDGVFFFDWGRVNTAHAMASHMVMAVANTIEKRQGGK